MERIMWHFNSFPSVKQRIWAISDPCAISQLSPSFPLSHTLFSLEVKHLGITLGGVRDGTRAISSMGIRVSFFASLPALSFPQKIWGVPFGCPWLWMTTTCFGFRTASVRCKISAPYFIGEFFFAFRSHLSFQIAGWAGKTSLCVCIQSFLHLGLKTQVRAISSAFRTEVLGYYGAMRAHYSTSCRTQRHVSDC